MSRAITGCPHHRQVTAFARGAGLTDPRMKLSQTPGRARRAALAAALFAGPPVCGALELAGPLVAPPATPLTTNGRAIADR